MTCIRPVLLVEDNPMDIDLSRRALARRNAAGQIELARDGAEALAWLARWEAGAPWPRLILLDLSLPKVAGLEVLRSLKTHPQGSCIPVVALAYARDAADLQSAYALGANSCVVKPAEFDQYVEMVAQLDHYWGVLNLTPVPASADA